MLRARAVLPTTVLSLLLAACASTVQTDRTSSTGVGSLGSPAAAVADPALGGGSLDAPVGSSAGGVGDPAGNGTSVSGGTGPGSGGPGGTDPSAPVPPDPTEGGGPTNDDGSGPIRIGVAYPSNANAANAALGASGVTLSDVRASMQAVIDDINEGGGIDGRPLEAVYHAYDAQSSDTKSNQDQAACSHFTEDDPVSLVIGSGQGENLDACLAKAGIVQVVTGVLLKRDEAYFDRYPTLFDVTGVSHDRVLADEAVVLERQGYFSGWSAQLGQEAPGAATVGVLSIDAPAWSTPLRGSLLPALARQGVDVEDRNIVEVYTPQGSSDATRTVTDIQNAVLRFRSNGVTHLVLMDTDGDLLLLYAQAARLQGYLPRLGLSSASGAQALYDSGLVTTAQLNGATGLGWRPTLDLPSRQAASYYDADATRCLDLLREKTGTSPSSTNAASADLAVCDAGYTVAAALRAVDGDLAPANLVRALEGLRDRIPSANLQAAAFGPGRHDAVVAGYDMLWDAACRCMEYDGARHTVR